MNAVTMNADLRPPALARLLRYPHGAVADTALDEVGEEVGGRGLTREASIGAARVLLLVTPQRLVRLLPQFITDDAERFVLARERVVASPQP